MIDVTKGSGNAPLLIFESRTTQRGRIILIIGCVPPRAVRSVL